MERKHSASNPRKRPVEDIPPASSSEKEVEEEAQQVASEENDAVFYGDENENADDDSEAETDSDRSSPSPIIGGFTFMPIVSNPTSGPKISTPSGKPTRVGKGSSLRKSERLLASPARIPNEKTKPALFQRVWSEEDELGILRCMIDYKSTTEKDPFMDIVGFHDLVKKSVRDDVNQNQLKGKMKRLKKRHETNMRKGASGEDLSFSKPHENNVFELAKKIWGVETKESKKSKKKAKISSSNDQDNGQLNVTLGLAARRNKDKKDVSQEGGDACKVDVMVDDKQEENAEAGNNYPYLKKSLEMEQLLEMPCCLKDFLKEDLGCISKEKAKELERKWREFNQDELKLYQKRIELVKELSQVALGFIKASNS